MKIKYLILPAFAVLASCSPDEGGGEAATAPLKVMSFNIRYSDPAGDTGDMAWSARKEACFSMFKDQAPDIAGLQEVRRDQLDDITLLPGYGFASVDVNEGVAGAKPFHNMIMYRTDRFTLQESGRFWLSATPSAVSLGWDGSQRRAAVWVMLLDRKAGTEVVFCSTHMDHEGTQARLKGAELLTASMSRIAGRRLPVFVAGDMNASYASTDTRRAQLQPFYDWMYSARDEAPATTDMMSFNNWGQTEALPTWNIDHIFYRNVSPKAYAVVDTPGYGVTYLSDHWPVTLVCDYR